jgi:predicted GH43/DUF377 family glycosyl hydrolase
MRIPIKRKNLNLNADSKRVIARFFRLPDERILNLVQSILALGEEEVDDLLNQILRDFAMRHRSITSIFQSNFKRVQWAVKKIMGDKRISQEMQLLIGAYFTNEYSIEAAAFFNPSIVEAPEQSGLEEGQKRVIVSLRATGEGHISSIVFRYLVIDADNDLHLMPAARRVEVTDVVKDYLYKKDSFVSKLEEMQMPKHIYQDVMKRLPERFNYSELMEARSEVLKTLPPASPYKDEVEKTIWLADSHHELHFSKDTDLSERVIFPISDFESRGIEDARFVKFTDDDGQVFYFATYCAYNGTTILPKLIQTRDFYNFKIRPLHGHGAQNKNLALFPRRIKGKFVMFSRIDGVNSFLMTSDRITVWEHPVLFQRPKHPWEFVQIGNCGSPIETDKGWLMITHGVGPMRRYSLGASLLDLDDPSKEIGRLTHPLLMPNEMEREGYVPNVVYSCGALINNGELIVPYAMSDYASSFMTVPVDALIDKILDDTRKDNEKGARKNKRKKNGKAAGNGQ